LYEELVIRVPFDPRPPRTYAPLPPDRWDNVGWAAEGGRIAIAGSDAGATMLAVALFLQKECGVRWWVPGALGEDVPMRDAPSADSIRKTVIRPSYYSREMSALNTSESRAWGVRNLLRGHINMTHSLPALLSKDVAGRHPDWFPSFDGKPFDPQTWSGRIPHPVFTNGELADFVAARVCEYFAVHPDMPSFSISPADTSLFGDLDIYAGLVDPKASFRGKVNMSNAVFTFYNAVARRVALEYPDRLLGALAYSFYEDVPDFRVESNVVPFLTADRAQWYDAQFKAEDLALVRKWVAAGPRLVGTWDYYYGFPFLIPRVMTSEVRESIPALYDAGVRVFFCEFAPIWGFDAPKAWVTSRLLWDSGADTEALTQEFFDGFFGPAAVLMRRFYEECDAVWMAQGGLARWLKYYGDAEQVLLFPPDKVRELRSILDGALGVEMPERYRARVDLVSTAFRYTERLCAAYPAWDEVARWTPDMPVERLLAAIPAYLAARTDMEAINRNCVGKSLNDLRRTLGFLTDDDPLAGRMVAVRATAGYAGCRLLVAAAPQYAGYVAARPVTLEGEPFADGAGFWFVTHWQDPGMEYAFEGRGRDGVLRVSGANSFSAQLHFDVRAGVTYTSSLRADGHVSADSTVRLLLEYLDAGGRTISFHADRLPCGDLKDAMLSVAGVAPKGTSSARLGIIIRNQASGDQVLLRAW